MKSNPVLFSLLFTLAVFPAYSQEWPFQGNPWVQTLKEQLQFQALVLTSDYVSAFVFCTADSQRCNDFAPSYLDFAQQFHDYIKVYAVDCVEMRKDTRFQMVPMCAEENEEYLPLITFFEPNEMKFNPYTKQPPKPKEHMYQGEASPTALFNFGRKLMPAFRRKITTLAEYDKFLDVEVFPNKVILFTNKPDTSPLYKAIASYYRDRLLFAEVNRKSTEVVRDFGIRDYPTLIVLERDSDGLFNEIWYEGEMKIDDIKNFLDKYALKERVANYFEESMFETPEKAEANKKKEEEENLNAKTGPGFKAKWTDITIKSFQEELNKHEGLVLVHIVKDEPYKLINETVERFQTMFSYYTFNVTDKEAENWCAEKLGIKNFPALAIYPVGKDKKIGNKLYLPKFKDFPEIMREVSDIIEDKSESLTPQDLQYYLQGVIQLKKPTFIYFYDSEETSMSFRVASQLSRFQGQYRFARMKNPLPEVKQQFQITKLPTFLVVFLDDPTKEPEDIKPEEVKVGFYQGRFILSEVIKFLDTFLPEEEVLARMKVNKKINHIQTQEELRKYCPDDVKLCIIGLVNGYNATEEDHARLANNEEQLTHVMKKYPHYSYMTIDAICHSELLLELNLMEELIPTVIIYDPATRDYAQLIGNYEKSDIMSFLEFKYLKKKVQLNPLRYGLNIDQRDCKAEHERRIEAEKPRELTEEELKELEEIREMERQRKGETGKEGKKKKKKDKKGKNDEL